MAERAKQFKQLTDADLREIVNLAPDAILLVGPDCRFTFVNDAACRLFGYTRAELLALRIDDVLPQDYADQLRSGRERIPRSGERTFECRLQRKDGSWLWAEVSARLRADGQWQGFVRDVSERKAIEAEREALFREIDADRRWVRTILETLPLGVLLFQKDGQLFYNRRAEELLGMKLSPADGSAQYADRILYPDGTPVPHDQLASNRVLRTGETVIAEEHLIARPDGSRIPALASIAPMRDADGQVVGAVGVIQDMSERMRMEQAIRANERLLRDIIDILPVGVWLADETGQLQRTNPAGERIWGGARLVPMSEFGQYKGWWVDSGEPIAPDEWGMARAIRRGETSAGELIRIQCFDGSFKTIIHSATPLCDDHGAITGAIVVNQDVTALHEAQEKQRASERLLRAVFDVLPVGVWLADGGGRLTGANPAARRIWGDVRLVGPEGYDQYEAWWVSTGERVKHEERALWRAIRHGETSRGELMRIRCFDGSFKTIIHWAVPIRSEAGEIVGGVVVNEDVTSLQQMQEHLRAAVREREEILAVVTHDLRNPLSALTSAALAVERQARALPGGERVRALAGTLIGVSRRMSGLVDDLLAVAVEAGGGPSMLQPAPVPAALLLAAARDATRTLIARRGLRLDFAASRQLPKVSADADRILRVLVNLLDNAVKFTPAPGRVRLAAEARAGGVCFSIANSGPALAGEDLDSMFRPFWQAATDRRGAGLGLSICRAIVEAHGGSIWAEPAEGERVRVCFVLPLATGPNAGG